MVSVPNGYTTQVMIPWGTPLNGVAPAFAGDGTNTAAEQALQIGANHDGMKFYPLPAGSENSDRGLLVVNHEYSNSTLYAGDGRSVDADGNPTDPDEVRKDINAHGVSVVELVRDTSGEWSIANTGFNRRITAGTTMNLSGPVAGTDLVVTAFDTSGMTTRGTVNNCGRGFTPWGTYLATEENFQGYVTTDEDPIPEEKARYGLSATGFGYLWGALAGDASEVNDEFARWDTTPSGATAASDYRNASNTFGWLVEIDPYNPVSTPTKRTAMGRILHEGAEPGRVIADRPIAWYMGDDNRFDYQYKYVSGGKVSDDRAANAKLLSDGTLYVARFDEDGTVTWLPLTHGTGPLTAENGFNDQGDVMIDTRIAADLLGATPMDRPEDAQPRGDGTAYIMLTNNTKRTEDEVNAANPRADSSFGHIIEIKEDGGNHAATKGRWSILVKCGDPSVSDVGAQWNPETSENGWFGSPDNCAIDADGRLWVSTDQGSNWAKTGKSDGLYAVETEGEARGTSKLFFRCPVGGEMCGPYFTDDGETLFVAVQHPGTDGTKNIPGFERESTFEDPATRWPDFDPKMPPRPAVVVVTKQGGGKIGV